MSTTATPDLLKPFKQHGAVFSSTTASGQAVGRCVFCKKEEHLFVNLKNQAWDCKSCGKKGGLRAFLKFVSRRNVEAFRGLPVVELEKSRAIRAETFRRFNLGWDSGMRQYTVPIRRLDGTDELHDLRYYAARGDKGVRSTAGCSLGLINWENLEGKNTIWLCEGEWDTMVMDEVLHDLNKRRSEIAVGVCGAGSFKAEWAPLFEQKIVNVLYDADEAGTQGMCRVRNMLSPVVRELKFINWPKEVAVGFDVRDLYKQLYKNTDRTYRRLGLLLKSEPPQSVMGGDAGTAALIAGKSDELKGKGLTREEVYRKYQKWLYWPKTCKLLSVVFGSVLANRRDGDPLWLFVVAPPGATKSEILMSLSDAPKIISTTSLTPAALISGATFAGGGDPSLIPRLNGKVLIVKDFTTILNSALYRDEIFGILRDAYDGKIEKQFGNGIYRKYHSKFGIIAGVTPALEQFTEGCAALGERFLQYWTPISGNLKDQKLYLERAQSNEGKEQQLRQDLLDTAAEVLAKDYTEVPKINPPYNNLIIELAQITALLRGVVPRDRFTKDVTHRSYHELGTRLTKEFVKLGIGIAQFHGVRALGEEEFSILRDVAYGSIATGIRHVLRAAWQKSGGDSFNLKDIGSMVRLPVYPTVNRIAQNLVALRVFGERAAGLKSEFVIKDDVLELLNSTKLFSREN